MRSHLSKSFFISLFGTVVILLVAAALPADAQITYHSCTAYPQAVNGQNYCSASQFAYYSVSSFANGAASCAEDVSGSFYIVIGGDTEADAQANGDGQTEVDSNASFTSDAIYVWSYAYSSAGGLGDSASSWAFADCYGNYSGFMDVFSWETSASAYADSNIV